MTKHTNKCLRNKAHSQACWDRKYAQYPGGWCLTCQGAGGTITDLGLSIYDSCPDCMEQGRCPRCGKEVWDEEYFENLENVVTCPECGWNDLEPDMLPLNVPECICREWRWYEDKTEGCYYITEQDLVFLPPPPAEWNNTPVIRADSIQEAIEAFDTGEPFPLVIEKVYQGPYKKRSVKTIEGYIFRPQGWGRLVKPSEITEKGTVVLLHRCLMTITRCPYQVEGDTFYVNLRDLAGETLRGINLVNIELLTDMTPEYRMSLPQPHVYVGRGKLVHYAADYNCERAICGAGESSLAHSFRTPRIRITNDPITCQRCLGILAQRKRYQDDPTKPITLSLD